MYGVKFSAHMGDNKVDMITDTAKAESCRPFTEISASMYTLADMLR